MDARAGLRLEERGEEWVLVGEGVARFGLVNEYLSHLLDRNYSPATVRAYGYDLLAFARWLSELDLDLDAVTTNVLLDYLKACRDASVPGRPGPNVVTMDGQRVDRYAATTINRRLAAISGLFAFVGLRDPGARNPVPKGREARWTVPGERSGMLAHTTRRRRSRSALRLREPKKLPTALSATDAAKLVGSLRTWRDRAIAGLMLWCGLRSCEVLGLDVKDVDIGGRWVTVTGKGAKQRRVPLDADVASVIDVYRVGQITSNSFMKREFGVPLIEEFFPSRDLRLVADTSGAYIPGHGTPTLILVGRNSRPRTAAVRGARGARRTGPT